MKVAKSFWNTKSFLRIITIQPKTSRVRDWKGVIWGKVEENKREESERNEDSEIFNEK